MEIGEIENLKKRVARLDEAPKKAPPVKAQSFRLGMEHVERLAWLSDRSGVSQTEIIRTLIDKEADRVKRKRAKRPAKSA